MSVGRHGSVRRRASGQALDARPGTRAQPAGACRRIAAGQRLARPNGFQVVLHGRAPVRSGVRPNCDASSHVIARNRLPIIGETHRRIEFCTSHGPVVPQIALDECGKPTLKREEIRRREQVA